MSATVGNSIKITAVETVQLPQYQNILWLRLHTDAGLIGLGETFRGADAVATYLHSEAARALIGANPLEIDRISKLMLEPYIGFRSSGVEIRGASAIDIALWDLFGKVTNLPIHQLLGGLQPSAHPHLQHLRRLQLQLVRPAARGDRRHHRGVARPL